MTKKELLDIMSDYPDDTYVVIELEAFMTSRQIPSLGGDCPWVMKTQ